MNARTITLPILAAAGLFSLAVPASAEEPEIVVTGKMKIPEGYEPVTEVVEFGDLDLATFEGEEELEKRVAAAVKKICWSHPKPARWQVKESEECDSFAWEGARPQMKQAIEKARGG